MPDRNRIDVEDRRSSNRIDAYDIGLQVSNGFDGEPIGIVGNVSLGGMMLITRRELQADGILQLRIDAPQRFGGMRIPLGAKILWCTPANSPDEHWAGLEIIDIAAEDQGMLEQLLARLSKQR